MGDDQVQGTIKARLGTRVKAASQLPEVYNMWRALVLADYLKCASAVAGTIGVT
jgi:hypothetical protein